jgi:uncharacterized membrane protein
MQRYSTSKSSRFFRGAIFGAFFMYLNDPIAGRRRRIVFRDKTVSKFWDLSCFLDKALRDLNHRVYGVFAEARYRLRGEKGDDQKIKRRIESKLGHYVSHPHAVQVLVEQGDVQLLGSILKHEVDRAVSAIEAIPGVNKVSRELVAQQDGQNTTQQESVSTPKDTVPEFRQRNWTPSLRLFVGVSGAGMLLSGLRGKGLLSYGKLLGGSGLLARAYLNQDLRNTLGLSGRRSGITIQKTLTIDAPVTDVFDFFVNPSSFPQFMRHVKEVNDLGHGKSHWVVAGPAGIPVSWDASITKLEPNAVIAWRSENNSPVANAGIIKFEDYGPEKTRVQITLSYSPPAGVIGDIATKIFGANPRRELEEDMNRVKSYLEGGRPAHDAAQRRGA